MTDRGKITCIYVGVVAISAAILATTFLIRKNALQPSIAPYYSASSKLQPQLVLEKDLTLTNQDGKQVKLSELKGKVWAFAQFYAACPMCAQRNGQGLKKLYDTFRERPDFQIVCMTVNPEEDDVEKLKAYAQTLGADTSNWWFLTGEPQELMDYMHKEMKFDPIQKREDPMEAAQKGEIAHNMSIAVYNREMGMVGRRDLYNAKQQGEAVYRETEKALHQMVDTVLKQK